MVASSGNVTTASDIDQVHGYYMMFGTMVLFTGVNLFITRLGTPKTVREDPWRWKNILISWVHALICGVWDILCLVLYPELFGDLILHINYFTFLMIPFSTGYFLYDSIDMLINKKLRQNWEVTAHHIAVASMFWFNFHQKLCIGYNVLALMAEVNSFFLHTRKLLQMIQVDYNSVFYKLVCLCNIVTFSFFRGYSNSRILIGMYIEYDRVPSFYYKCLTMSMSCMTLINIFLFWRLLKSDFLRNRVNKSVNPGVKSINSESNMNGDRHMAHVKKE
ncbi:TLC domain-containing protein 2-like [Mizuhopecten yessoensis]|uniref:TLC domain-containing protein 2 n=1 Tax=Mizuhopecten yessoensis TaxID=6573 RepID=A0A210PYN4_MIZYE|nr:TLC domain-containing protein 2-like [Mizuhopecten yessoensis]OWF41596.1 TLC domain-containing protein 2 [Mizuhopecten yessoensis]